MKHVCELAIIGLLLRSVKTRVVLHKVGLISQSEGLFVGFCCTHITNTHVRDCEKFKLLGLRTFFLFQGWYVSINVY